jgi:hypothetical protein
MHVDSLVCEDIGAMCADYMIGVRIPWGENTIEHDIAVPSKTSTV